MVSQHFESSFLGLGMVSVMLGYQARREQFAQYQDGVRTQRNTFQKYFAQDEFRDYLESTLKRHAIPIAPGICLVFRNQVDEQLFLLLPLLIYPIGLTQQR